MKIFNRIHQSVVTTLGNLFLPKSPAANIQLDRYSRANYRINQQNSYDARQGSMNPAAFGLSRFVMNYIFTQKVIQADVTEAREWNAKAIQLGIWEWAHESVQEHVLSTQQLETLPTCLEFLDYGHPTALLYLYEKLFRAFGVNDTIANEKMCLVAKRIYDQHMRAGLHDSGIYYVDENLVSKQGQPVMTPLRHLDEEQRVRFVVRQTLRVALLYSGNERLSPEVAIKVKALQEKHKNIDVIKMLLSMLADDKKQKLASELIH